MELDTKESLIQAAIVVFAKKGFDGATVKDIADAAGANVSLISYYFDGKEGIYRACLERFGRDRLAVAERSLKPVKSVTEMKVRLSLLAEEFLHAHIEHRDIMQIIHRECSSSDSPFMKELFRDTFFKVFQTMLQFLKTCAKDEIISKEIDPHLAAVSFFGSLVHFCRTEQIQKEFFGKSLEDPKYREKVASHCVKIFVEGIK
ncbi:TetR family transcriptional regulator [bacterium]|jgi:AcrR family transcriptional regulator|nr:TetR family transcriptional regulator [bacterium]